MASVKRKIRDTTKFRLGIKERFSEEVILEVSPLEDRTKQLKKRVNNGRREWKAFWTQKMAHPASQRLEKAY